MECVRRRWAHWVPSPSRLLEDVGTKKASWAAQGHRTRCPNLGGLQRWILPPVSPQGTLEPRYSTMLTGADQWRPGQAGQETARNTLPGQNPQPHHLLRPQGPPPPPTPQTSSHARPGRPVIGCQVRRARSARLQALQFDWSRSAGSAHARTLVPLVANGHVRSG